MKTRQKLSIMLSLVLMLSISIFVPTFAEETRTITIIHTNDVHGRAEGNDKDIIGYAKLKTFVDQTKKDNKATLLVDAGDTLHGTTFANIAKGENMIKLMNMLGYNVATPGNHDFNYGYERLIDLTKKADFPYVCSNVVRKDGTTDFLPNTIINVEGTKVGFFGLATPETKYKSSPKNTEGVKFEDYLEVAKKQVADLKQNGAEIVVCISHLGLDKASKERSDILAEKVDGIDLIIDGHSHTKLENGLKVKNTVIAQTGEYLKNVGVVNIHLTPTTKIEKIDCSLLSYDKAKQLKPDEYILKEIENGNLQNKPVLAKVIGTNKQELIGVREKVRTSQTNLGDLITDAMRDAIKADVAITNGGGIRASIPQGEITMGNVLTTFPFTNFVIGIEATGQDIKDALEHGVDKAPQPEGKFPQVSGITYNLDLSKKAGSRVSNIKINGEAIDLNKVYKLATNDFMSIGGDGYTMLKDHKKFAENALLSDVLVEFIKEKGSVIDYKDSTRVHLVKEGEEPAKDEEKEAEPKTVKENDLDKIIANIEGTSRVKVSMHKMILNGKSVMIPCYVIDGKNYFRIRELSAAFRNTDTPFDVGYNDAQRKIIIKNGQSTQTDKGFAPLKSVQDIMDATQNIEINGQNKTGQLKVYEVDGTTFFDIQALKPLLNLNI